MKKILLVLITMLSANLMAQNWSPILVNHKMNYQHSDSSYISHTIWVDSTQLSGTDSVFYLNRVVKDVPGNPEIVLRNQPQFLMEMMVREIYGIYSFIFPNHYFIGTQFGIGSSWTFDMTNNINAEITELLTENIFGIQDSVKVISLSDGNDIRLSKNFGILKFPDFENDGYYELVGIQNTEFGESVPDFWDIYDFEVGDVFQLHSEWYIPGEYEVKTTKTRINSKEIYNDHYTYNINRITRKLLYGQVSFDFFEGDMSYYYDDYYRINKFQNDSIYLAGLDCSPNNSDPYLQSKMMIYFDSLGIITKQWGVNFGVFFYNYENLYYNTDPPGDTLIKLGEVECFGGEPHGVTYAKSLGLTSTTYNDNFESWNYSYLMGYVKNGDTIGTIWSDSLLLVGIEAQNLSQASSIKVYPNPTNDWLNFEQICSKTTLNIEIQNLFGQIVKEVNIILSSHYILNVADLKAGVYFYLIKDENQIIQKGKVIIK